MKIYIYFNEIIVCRVWVVWRLKYISDCEISLSTFISIFTEPYTVNKWPSFKSIVNVISRGGELKLRVVVEEE